MKKLFLLSAILLAFTASSIAQMNSGPLEKPTTPIYVENQIIANRAPGDNFLVFMDNLPWSSNAIQEILNSIGAAYSVLNSSAMSTENFDLYDVIIIPSDQVTAFYANFSANLDKFIAFVDAGGSLEVHAATCGHYSPCGYSVLLPGGVRTVEQYESNNIVTDALHPIVAGVPSPFSGSYASHGIFVDLVAGTDIITITESNSLPTTIQYRYGSGIVTATTCTYEFGYSNGQAAGVMLVNNIGYSFDHSQIHVPVSDWAIGIGIFLILMAAFIRYKRFA